MANQPKILLIATTDLVYDQRMQKVATSLAANGAVVTLVGRLLKQSTVFQLSNVVVKRWPCWWTKGVLFYLEYQIRILWAVLFTKANIIYAADMDTLPGAAIGCALLRLWNKKSLVFDAHELFSEQEEVVSRPLIKRIWALAERLFIPMADVRITVSQSVADHYNKITGQTFEVVRNLPVKQSMPAKDWILPELEAMVPYMLYVGAVNKNRGLEQVLASMAFHGFNLVVCGDGPDLEALRQTTATLRLEDRVLFTGYVDPADLGVYYQQAFVGLLLLAGDGLNYKYSLANKCFDYMQYGLPQLVSPNPEYLALQKKYNSFCFCNPEPAQITEAIQLLATDINYRNKLIEASIAASQKLNWETESKKLVRQILRSN